MKKPKPNKVPFDQVQIDTWAPTMPNQPWIAMFRGLPMIFKGNSQSEVTYSATAWRDEEVRKEASKQANAQAASERMKARAKKSTQ